MFINVKEKKLMVYFSNWNKLRLAAFVLVLVMILPCQIVSAEYHKRNRGENLADGTAFGVKTASWYVEDSKLKITGFGAGRKKIVSVINADTMQGIGTTRSEDDGKFEFSKSHIDPASCKIIVQRYDGEQIRKTVCENSDGGSDGSGGTTANTDYTLLAWNDLGMHCMDGTDYSIFSILPPYNNLHAHLIKKQGTDEKLISSGVTITYEAVADDNGSINTSSAAPSNYWDFVSLLYEPLFGPTPAVDVGLLGNPTQSETPAHLGYNDSFGWWEAEGIPTDPYNDNGAKDFYPLVKVVAKDLSGKVLATTTTVLPVSDEMDCRACHASGSPTLAKPAAGWVEHSDSEKDYKLNILRLHDEKHDISGYLNALADNGYIYTASLYETSLNGTPILCSSCHGSNALPGTGVDGIAPLTASLHGSHAKVIDPATRQQLDDSSNRTACYRCHPGAETQCLRGAMGAAVAPDNTSLMSCQSCHGTMSDVGSETRVGWLAEPNCQSCHFNTQRLLETDVQSSGDPSDTRFATNPDTPMPGTDLFRFSKGHGGLQCEACHGSTHAIYPSAEPKDNIQSLAVQGHVGTIAECSACHSSMPSTSDKGPHGLHTIGQNWVRGHEDIAEHNAAQCASCHGENYQGTAVSKTSMARTLSVEGHTITFPAGHIVGCYDCHNGPGGD